MSFTKRQKGQGLVGPVKFRFQHDLESLWWVALWILLYRVGGIAALVLAREIFTHGKIPSEERVAFFESRDDDLTGIIREELKPLVAVILDIRGIIGDSYLDIEKTQNFMKPSTYSDIYRDVWPAFVTLASMAIAIGGVDFQDQPSSLESSTDEETQKRSLSPSKSTGAPTNKRLRPKSRPGDDEDYRPTRHRKKVICRKHI